jgi:hypothetical protein
MPCEIEDHFEARFNPTAAFTASPETDKQF